MYIFFFPSFLEIHFDEVPAFIAGFAYGPMSAVFILIVKTLVKLPMTITAGVGENDDYLREKFCEGMEELGLKLDKEANKVALARKGVDEAVISTPDSDIKIFMIATNEELVIVEDTLAIMNGTYNPDHLKMAYSFAKQKTR